MVISLRERKKIDTRQRIITEAVRIFGAKGIEAATVDDIAAAANVGKGTIYNYFETKEEIVVAFMVDLETAVQARMAGFLRSGAPMDEVLAGFIRFQFRLKRPHLAFVRVFLSQMFARSSEFGPHIRSLQSVIDPPLRELFNSLRQRGRIGQSVDIDELIIIFKTMHLGITGIWAIEGPPWRQTNRVLKEQMRLFCSGLENTK